MKKTNGLVRKPTDKYPYPDSGPHIEWKQHAIKHGNPDCQKTCNTIPFHKYPKGHFDDLGESVRRYGYCHVPVDSSVIPADSILLHTGGISCLVIRGFLYNTLVPNTGEWRRVARSRIQRMGNKAGYTLCDLERARAARVD